MHFTFSVIFTKTRALWSHTHTRTHAHTHTHTHTHKHIIYNIHLLLILDRASSACIHAFLCSALGATRLRWVYFGPWTMVKHCSSGTSAAACCIISVLRPARSSRIEAMSTAARNNTGTCTLHRIEKIFMLQVGILYMYVHMCYLHVLCILYTLSRCILTVTL